MDVILLAGTLSQPSNLIPITPVEYRLFSFRHGGWGYYDRCLQMGCSSSCNIFEHYGKAVQWVATKKSGIPHIIRYLDDYFTNLSTLFGGPTEITRFGQVYWSHTLTQKMVDLVQQVVFRGVLLDMVAKIAILLQDNLDQYTLDIQAFLASSYQLVRNYQKIIGQLQWANSVVLPGWPFLQRIIDGMVGAQSQSWLIFIDHEMKLD